MVEEAIDVIMFTKNPLSLKINDIGIIVNPSAGAGREIIESVASSAIEMFKESHVIHPPIGEGREATMRASAELSLIVDAILVVGGDGTMSDVAYSLFTEGATTPIIGIGAGSTNAGPLITVRAKELKKLDPQKLSVQKVGGILAILNNKKAGLGFNDIVLGNTVLTTLDGCVVQVSAADFMNGKKTPASPLRAGTRGSEVSIVRSGETPVRVHKGVFGQMFAAPLEERYLGKGLAGGTSLAAALGLPAGIAITSEPLINYSIGQEELLAMEPIITKTASFRNGDEVVVRGLKEGTCLIADGNPLAILGTDDAIRLHYVPAAANAIKLSL